MRVVEFILFSESDTHISAMNYDDSEIPMIPSDSGTYIAVFPSVSKKAPGLGPDEAFIRQLYTEHPHCSYYQTHESTGNRAKPGTVDVHPPTDECIGVVNMYIKVYPGTKDGKVKIYPNDNPVLRQKRFGAALEQLSTHNTLRTLHLRIPSDVKSEKQQYIQYMEDFLVNMKLQYNRDVKIVVHGTPVEKQPIKAKVKPKVSDPISVTPKARGTKPIQSSVPTPTPARTVYQLDVKDEDIHENVFYEIDFVRYTQTQDNSENVLQYFPDGWDRISTDPKLRQLAITVTEKLGDQLGADNVFPPVNEIFNAFTYCTDPKVVIFGQDPYHGKGQAHGLSFSVREGVTVPPSLRNIYTALENDTVEFTRPKHGCLVKWAEQGIILLNTALTVEQKKPKSHLPIWEPFTNRLVELLSTKYDGIVFVLWGTPSKAKKSLIGNKEKHLILEYNHPSPMVRNNKFATECTHFSQINEYLEKSGREPITW